MSKIKELKNNPKHIINLVETLESLCLKEKTHNHISLLMRIIQNDKRYQEHVMDGKKFLLSFSTNELNNDLSYFIISVLSQIGILNRDVINTFNIFSDYKEKGLLSKGIHEFKTIDDLKREVNEIDIRRIEKEIEKEVINIHTDNEWYVLKPMSYFASKKYGYGTKWCTSSSEQSYSFFEYSQNGILIYCINKISGLKVAVFKNLIPNEHGIQLLSFWNQVDSQVDSLESELPEYIIKIVLSEIKNNYRTNSSYSEFNNVNQNLLSGLPVEETEEPVLYGGIVTVQNPQPNAYLLNRNEPYMGDLNNEESGDCEESEMYDDSDDKNEIMASFAENSIRDCLISVERIHDQVEKLTQEHLNLLEENYVSYIVQNRIQ